MNDNEEVGVEVWDRSTVVDEVLRYATYLYLEHVSSELTNNSLHTKYTKWEKWIMYKVQGAKLSMVFKSLPDSVADACGIMKT